MTEKTQKNEAPLTADIPIGISACVLGQEVQEVIASYRAGHVPLVVPVTLLRHRVRRHGIDCLAQQTCLDPHPTELMPRNHG